MDPIVIDLEFAAPVEELWGAFTEGTRLGQWLCTRAHVEPEEGGAFELFWDAERDDRNSTLGCRIRAIEEEYSFRADWKGPEEFADLMNGDPPATSIFVRFQPLGPARCRLHLEHLGWGEGERWSAARASQNQRWTEALAKLRPLLES